MKKLFLVFNLLSSSFVVLPADKSVESSIEIDEGVIDENDFLEVNKVFEEIQNKCNEEQQNKFYDKLFNDSEVMEYLNNLSIKNFTRMIKILPTHMLARLFEYQYDKEIVNKD